MVSSTVTASCFEIAMRSPPSQQVVSRLNSRLVSSQQRQCKASTRFLQICSCQKTTIDRDKNKTDNINDCIAMSNMRYYETLQSLCTS